MKDKDCLTSQTHSVTRRRIVGILLAGVASALLLPGCGGSNNPDTASSGIVARYNRLQSAVENKDIDRVMSLVSPHYLQSGQTYDDFRQAFVSLFADLATISATFSVVRINFDSTNPEYADVTFDGLIVGRNLQTGQIERNDVGGQMIWHREGGDWVMYGNQQTTAGIRSKSRPDGLATLLGKKRS
ncbi:MAG TPA: nuclear transport factor 2 family protein [Armatimonadota bacterium]|jgi:hypothetical protein